MSYMNSEYKIC